MEREVFFSSLTLFISFWLPWVFVAARRHSLAAASCSYSLAAVHGLLIVVVSLIVEHVL